MVFSRTADKSIEVTDAGGGHNQRTWNVRGRGEERLPLVNDKQREGGKQTGATPAFPHTIPPPAHSVLSVDVSNSLITLFTLPLIPKSSKWYVHLKNSLLRSLMPLVIF